MQMWHAVNRGAYVCLASETRHRRNMAPVHVACPKFATRAAVGAAVQVVRVSYTRFIR